MTATDVGDYSWIDPMYLGMASPYTQETVMMEATFESGFIFGLVHLCHSYLQEDMQ